MVGFSAGGEVVSMTAFDETAGDSAAPDPIDRLSGRPDFIAEIYPGGAGIPQMGELAVERTLAALAEKNVAAASVPFFLGAGAYRHHVPATVDHLIQRSEFLTSYTPYQPEISQGTLQVLFEFQTQVALLTGMEVANASMYDGSTACGEAMLMAHRLTRRRIARSFQAVCIPSTPMSAPRWRAMAGDEYRSLKPLDP